MMSDMEEALSLEEEIEELGQELAKMECQARATGVHMEDVGISMLREVMMECLGALQGLDSGEIGIKRMGKLDNKPFLKACKERYPEVDAETKAAVLVSMWQAKVEEPTWQPYKAIFEDCKHVVVIDEEDEDLKGLKNEWGEEVYDAVVNTLLDLKEYNPRRMWNFEEDREASIAEATKYFFKQEVVKNALMRRKNEDEDEDEDECEYEFEDEYEIEEAAWHFLSLSGRFMNYN